jgi:hypothetical protein
MTTKILTGLPYTAYAFDVGKYYKYSCTSIMYSEVYQRTFVDLEDTTLHCKSRYEHAYRMVLAWLAETLVILNSTC